MRLVYYRSIFSHLGLLRHALTPSWLIMGLLGLNLQCAWTPEVETIVYESPQGSISLRSTQALRIPPDHPRVLPESLVQKILAGINLSQEGGMLQQLLLSTSGRDPAFTQAQIEFLAPQISLALSKATREETVHFRISAGEKEASPLHGTVALFSPSYFLLLVNPAKDFSEMSSKMRNSSRHLQNTLTLVLSPGEVEVGETNLEAFMDFPSSSSGIMVNYQILLPSDSANKSPVSAEDRFINKRKDDSLPDLETLRKQLNDLQQLNDEQSEEIRRLRQSLSPQKP